MIEVIGAILIFIGGLLLASFLTMGLLILAVYFKNRVSHMTEEKWELYFKNLSNGGMLFRLFLIHAVSLCVISLLCFFLFEIFRYEYASILSLCFILFGIMLFLAEYRQNKNAILEKFRRMRAKLERQ